MITQSEFAELVKDVFSNYIPKVKQSERNVFVEALIDEMVENGFEFEEDLADTDDFPSDEDGGFF